MKVLVISDHLHQGGAAVACNRLCEALARLPGTVVHRFVFNPCSSPGKTGFEHTQATGLRIESLFQAAGGVVSDRILTSSRRSIAARRLGSLVRNFQPDVVNLHNLHGFSDALPIVIQAIGKLPVAWTLHDMWSFTGRCAYAYDCPKFTSRSCDATCPTCSEYPSLPPPRVAPALKRKQAFLENRPRTAAVCPSAWLAREAKRGLWSDLPVEPVPNGLPLDVFFPVDKKAARAALGLPEHGLLGLMAADYLVERRKGGDMIAQALSVARRPDFGLLTMGHARGLTIDGVPMHSLGYVSDDRVKRLAYSAADLLIHPAPVDNLPNTVVEALACGTPSIAFHTGGLPELVLPGQTGWLCSALTAPALGAALQASLQQLADGLRLGAFCRARAEALHSDREMAGHYVGIFNRLRT